jgi:hypothetical protein
LSDNPSNDELRRAASDPATPQATLAALAYDHPDLRQAIALNPSSYEGLLEWLGELDDEDVTAALEQRAAGNSEAPSTEETATLIEPPPAEPAAQAEPEVATAAASIAAPLVATPGPTVASAPSDTPSNSAPRTSRRLKISLIAAAAVIVVIGLVLGGTFAFASFAHPNGSLSAGGALTAAGSPAQATDYRFGATQTWQTKVNVLPTASDGYTAGYANLQTYPGLWLVSWPGDDSAGSGRLTSETLLAMNPNTGAVNWSMSPGPYACASALTVGALTCVDTMKASLSVLNPLTGKETNSPLNGAQANSVSSYKGDIVFGYENPAANVVDTIERVKLDGTVVWKQRSSCAGSPPPGGLIFSTLDAFSPATRARVGATPNDRLLDGACMTGTINLDTGAINPASPGQGDDSCKQYSPFLDYDGLYTYGDACVTKQYPMLIPHGSSTLTAMTMDQYLNNSKTDGANFPTLWSAELPDANLSRFGSQRGIAHLGAYALLASGGHLYGVDTAQGPSWEQSHAFSDDGHVLLLPIDPTKPNTPVLALEVDHNTVMRIDAGFGATRVSAEPAALPGCPNGQTPVSFSTWDNGKGATLVCQGFARTVTVVLILDGTTYTSVNGATSPTGYYADFGGGVSVNIGLGGWTAWVHKGGTTTLHSASSGWLIGDVTAQTYPVLKYQVEACPSGTFPLSLSTWNGGWLLTCGTMTATITRFVYTDGSAHGSGQAMAAQGGQSCGVDSTGGQVCVSANPAVVSFSSKGGSQTQHSVAANYVVGKGFSGAGKGTGAYGLADPKADAASEVGYLNGILQQSQAARSSVKIVVQDILKCASVQADVQSAQAVVANRTTELQSLSSAPVDAVPGGMAMVSQLQAALQDSLTADQAYVTAAGQVASGQCAAGKATYDAQAAVLTQGDSEKTTFTNAWNTQIATQYGMPTYTQADI